ncbi:MAG: nitroreductase family protein [Candidatus Cloacimonadaceae bacterium]|nr:nitroreductase family protein [Candidatus Cloacimonadaceae bacterium]MDP3114368.1 nitroreductase family protein [Candidatus Cloacimonadaceae bacterium]
MSGIVFMQTRDLTGMVEFYGDKLGMELWLDQGGCCIMQSGNMLLAFCQRDKIDSRGVITFFYPDRAGVDEMYQKLAVCAKDRPKLNPVYNIYHFYASDPEGRKIEFQCFEQEIKPYLTAKEALIERRSVRKYKQTPVSDALLKEVFELCRYSPTARNMQAYYYIVIKDREILSKIVELRGSAGAPILAAPFAIAVCAKGELSKRVVQDACIAAYHLLLAAKTCGLGTCWVTDMDNDAVKELLQVPKEDYIACLTPIGFPDEEIPIPHRHEVHRFVRHIPEN